MPHFRIDDALHSHPKAQRAGDEAMGMWTRAGSYCMAYLTDGFVPEWWVKQQPKGVAKAKKLVECGLWHDGAEKDGETGYIFHEFVGPGRQDSREKVEADREFARKRKQKSRQSSQEESHSDTHRDEPSDYHRDYHRESQRSPTRDARVTQPNPTLNGGQFKREGPGELADDTPPPPCPDHPNGWDHNHPCRRCRALREHDEAAPKRAIKAKAQQLAELRRLRQDVIDACPHCDHQGQAPHPDIPDATTPCDQHEKVPL